MAAQVHLRLREARQRAGFRTARDFARACGLPEPTYRAHENGSRGLPVESAQHYAGLLGVSAGWLLTGEGTGKKDGHRHAPVRYTIDTSFGGVTEALTADQTYSLSVVPPRGTARAEFFGAVVEGDALAGFPDGTELVFTQVEDALPASALGKYVLCEETRPQRRRRFFGRLIESAGGLAIEFPSNDETHRRIVPYLERPTSAGLSDVGRGFGPGAKPRDTTLPSEVGGVRIVGLLVRSIRPE